jgi:hypothetical protein
MAESGVIPTGESLPMDFEAGPRAFGGDSPRKILPSGRKKPRTKVPENRLKKDKTPGGVSLRRGFDLRRRVRGV